MENQENAVFLQNVKRLQAMIDARKLIYREKVKTMSDDVFTDMLEDENEPLENVSWEMFIPKKQKEWAAIRDEEDEDDLVLANWLVMDENGDLVANVHGRTVGDCIANADLIAAAPSMRRALHRILHCDDIESAIRIAKHAGAETANSDIPGGSWEEQCLAARELKNLFLAEAARLREEKGELIKIALVIHEHASGPTPWGGCKCDHGEDGRSLLKGEKCERCKALERLKQISHK